MGIKSLNEHALLYNGAKNAELDSVLLKGRSKVNTPKETDDEKRIVNIEFINKVKEKLEEEIANTEELDKSIGNLRDEIEGKLKALEDTTKTSDKKLDDKISDVEDRVNNLNPYIFRGNCNYNELPNNANIGDVWNVIDSHNNIPAGTNYAWNGREWDNLGGEFYIDVFTENETKDLVEEIFSINI